MAEQRLIDGNELRGVENLLNTDIIQSSKEASWLLSQVIHDIDAMPTIDPETLPIVQELREKLEQVEQELRQVKYCYDIAKNAEKQLRRQNDDIIAAWAECAKRLKQVIAELEDKGEKEYDQTGTYGSHGLGARDPWNAEPPEQLEEE